MTDDHDIVTPDVRFHLIRRMEHHKVVGLAGHELQPHERKYLEFHRVAGVILFDRNVRSVTQVVDLVGATTELLSVDDIPPLVMADHEGDVVSALRRVIGVPPSALAIAATGDVELAREVAYETGLVMRKVGVNTVLAPVADCFFRLQSPVTGLRTFGRNPLKVAEFVSATVDGFKRAGVVCCVKHFPGHGATREDSHDTLPEVLKSIEELRNEDLIPFQAAIKQGVEMVMTSHVAYPFEKDTLIPASFDRRLLHGELRDRLAFNGVTITDALEMAGASWYARSRFGDLAGGYEQALLAGSDLLLHTRPIPETVRLDAADDKVQSINVMDTIIKTLDKVVGAQRGDEVLNAAAEDSEPLRNLLALLDASAARVSSLRKNLAPKSDEGPRVGGKVVSFDAYPSVPKIYDQVAERAIRATDKLANFDLPDVAYLVMPVVYAQGETLGRQHVDDMANELVASLPDVSRSDTVVRFVVDDDGDLVPDVARSAPKVIDASRYVRGQGGDGFELEPDQDLVLLFSARGVPDEEFMAGLQRLADLHDPALIIVTGWPILDWIPDGVPTLVTAGASVHVARAVVRVLTGDLKPDDDLSTLLPGDPYDPLPEDGIGD